MRFWFAIVAVLALIFGGTAAFAQEAKSGCSHDQSKATAQSESKSCADKATAKGSCSSKLAMSKGSCNVKGKDVAYDLPAVIYQVGDKKVCSEPEALELAKGDASKVQFVVGEKTYATKTEAMDAYAATLDSFLNERMLTVRFAVGDEVVSCPMAAKDLASKNHGKVQYRVASFNFESQEAAAKAVKLAREAAGSAKSGCCSKDAKNVASKDGGKCCASKGDTAKKTDGETKTVAAGGETKTCSTGSKSIACCETIQSKVTLAQAKIEAAVKVLAEQAGV
ncbi:MAG: hypothetical protein AB7Q17_08340 [Phycisphaerae bacterium]